MVDHKRGAGIKFPFLNWWYEHENNGEHIFLHNVHGIGGSDGLDVAYAEQFTGGDIGAQVNAAFTAGARHVIITGSATLTTTITPPANTILEFAPGATVGCVDDTIMIDMTGSHYSQIINPILSGANDVTKTNNYGIYIPAATSYPIIKGGYISYCYYGIYGIGGGGIIEDSIIGYCTHSGFYSDASTTGTIKKVSSMLNTQYGFHLISNNIRLFSCVAASNGKHGYYLDDAYSIRCFGCLARNNGTSAANTYDGFKILRTAATTMNNSFVSCESRNTVGANQRYGLYFDGSGYYCEIIGGLYDTNATGSYGKSDGSYLFVSQYYTANIRGIGGSTGKMTVWADQYAGADMVTKMHTAAADCGAGGTVMIPAGVYADCVEFNPADGVTYIGAARGIDDGFTGATEIRFASATTPYGVNANSKTNFKLINITFRGALSGGLPSVQYHRFNNSTNFICENVQFCYCNALSVSSGCIGARFKNCQVFKTYLDGVRYSATGANNSFEGCDFTAVGRSAPSTLTGFHMFSGANFPTLINCTTKDWDANYRPAYGFVVDAGVLGATIIGGYYGDSDFTDDWSDAVGVDIHCKHSVAGWKSLNNGWIGLKNRGSAPAANGILSASDITSIQGLKAYLAGAEQTIVVKTLLAALDIDFLPDSDITRDLGSATKRWKDLFLQDLILSRSVNQKMDRAEWVDFTNWRSLFSIGSATVNLDVRRAQINTGATAGNDARAFVYANGVSEVVDYSKVITLETRVKTTARSTGGDFAIRFAVNTTLGNLANSGIGFQIYYDGVAAQWRILGEWCTAAGVRTTVETTPVNIANDTWYVLRIEFRHTTGEVSFYVNGALLGTGNANLPSNSAASFDSIQVRNNADAANNALKMKHNYFEIED